MAMRLRRLGVTWFALCAAETQAQPGDVYLNDAQDHAIRDKLARDFNSEQGYGIPECSHCPAVPRSWLTAVPSQETSDE